ncbi:MAG: MASE3 domain-containing protein [Clostridia bacterium]|nr:MASE3 domain-containing protein [Clostridia bacterium]
MNINHKENNYIYIIIISVVAFVLLLLFSRLSFLFDRIFTEDLFLAWHNTLEFLSIIMAFCIFVVAFYTYDLTGNFRSIFIAVVLLSVGIIDVLHTFSYQGMPDFFIKSCAEKATTFWMIARFTAAIGIVIFSFIKPDKKIKMSKHFLLLFSMIYTGVIIIIVALKFDMLPAMYVEGVGLTPAKIYGEYIIVALQAFAAFILFLEYRKTKNSSLIYFICSLIISIFSEFAFTLYTDVYDKYNMLGHIYKFISYYLIFQVMFVEMVKKPYKDLTSAEKQLSSYSDNLKLLVEERTKEIKDANKKLMEDLEYAKNIQMALLPDTSPEMGGLGFSSKYIPYKNVGGDFYNFIKIDDENIAMYIGDVSGHGVSAAMLTVFVNRTITSKRTSEGRNELLNPASILDEVYEVFNLTNFPEDIYLVMIYAVYNIKTHALTYASAGLNTYPIIFNDNNLEIIKDIEGFPICKFSDYYKPQYREYTVQLDKGDRMILYTDGLVEAKNKYGQQFEFNNLIKLLEECRDRDTYQLSDKIVEGIRIFTEDAQITDDISFFIMDTDIDSR